MFKKLIYLASPYSHPDTNVITRRVLEVQDATARLIEAGHLIFSPIVHSHNLTSFLPADKSNSLDFWLEFDLKMIDKADELWILRLDGHTRSKGIHAELYHALEQGKKVRYINYPDLSTFADVEACTVNAEGFPDVWEEEFQKDKYATTNTFGKAFPEGPSDQADGFAAELHGCHEVSINGNDCFGHPQTPTIIGCFCRGSYLCETHRRKEISKPTIIGLTGHAHSGKDTAGKYLVDNRGFTRIGLADAVKECLYALDPWADVKAELKVDVSVLDDTGWCQSQSRTFNDTDYISVQKLVDINGWDTAKLAPTVRKYLQLIGTEVGRKIISETVWLDIAERKIKELGPDARVVITDIRFPNEAEWVRALGGQVVRINRDGFGPVNDHASDARLDDALVDAELQNDFTLDNLYEQIETRIIPYA